MDLSSKISNTNNLVDIYLDSDGVFTDLFGFVSQFVKIDHDHDPRSELAVHDFIDRMTIQMDLYRHLDPQPDIEEAKETVDWLLKKGHKVCILTNLGQADIWEKKLEDKKIWYKNQNIYLPVCYTRRSKDKGQFCNPERPAILVDDFEVCGRSWQERGGTWIHHKNWVETRKQLEQLVGK